MTDRPDNDDARHPPMVLFRSARTPFEARIVAAVLEDAGIPAFVPDGSLADEFALSQRLMNAQSVDVHVPADRVADAEAALAAAKAAGEAMADETADVPGDEDDEADG